MTQLLLLGAPGAGKGTQGQLLSVSFGVPHISTGKMLREHVARRTQLGRRAQAFMDRGDLVPDDVVFDLVARRLAGPPRLEGFVLDGFPRTLEQAVRARAWAKENGYGFSAVVHLQVDADELLARLTRRAGRSGRIDDAPEMIMVRLERYRAESAPMLAFYRRRGILVEVDGTGEVDEVAQRIMTSLAARGVVPAAR
jgi:adenylate kinase